MGVMDTILNLLNQWQSGQTTLGNNAYNNMMAQVNRPDTQATINRQDAPSTSGRGARLKNEDMSRNNLALMNMLIGQGYNGGSGNIGLGSILPYLLQYDPEMMTQDRLKRNEQFAWAANKPNPEGINVGGDVFSNRYGGTAGALLGAATGSPWFSQADKANMYTNSNKIDDQRAGANYAKSNEWNVAQLLQPLMTRDYNKNRNIWADYNNKYPTSYYGTPSGGAVNNISSYGPTVGKKKKKGV